MKYKEFYMAVMDNACFSYRHNYKNKEYIVFGSITLVFAFDNLLCFCTPSKGKIYSFDLLTEEYTKHKNDIF